MSSQPVVILANGILPDITAARRIIPQGALLICADGGLRHAQALGLTPDVLIGDLDSVHESDLAAPGFRGVTILRHPPDKDQTDLELALDHAIRLEPSAVTIVAALGARLDHTLGNIALLADPRLAGCDVHVDDGVEELFFCRGRVEVRGAAGDLISLVPWGGPADGVRTTGLRWPLNGDRLLPSRSRGISNEMLQRVAAISIETGSLLVIHRRLTPAAAIPKG